MVIKIVVNIEKTRRLSINKGNSSVGKLLV